ncbi:MAG: hypothetical protein IT428_31440 [Planctomycetaceae bacterium]|nr:hypothetical protein [Planctomycetaceae bacterium]
MTAFLITGSLAFAAVSTPEPPRAVARFPVHVNDVRGRDELQVSMEFSLRIHVLNPPATHGEMIRMVGGKPVMLEVPLFDDLSRSVGDKGLRARVRQP